jgi:hypothetical protein
MAVMMMMLPIIITAMYMYGAALYLCIRGYGDDDGDLPHRM